MQNIAKQNMKSFEKLFTEEQTSKKETVDLEITSIIQKNSVQFEGLQCSDTVGEIMLNKLESLELPYDQSQNVNDRNSQSVEVSFRCFVVSFLLFYFEFKVT